MRFLTPADVDRFAFGVMLLGSGGGGQEQDVYTIALMLRQALLANGDVRLLDPDEADPDGFGIRVGFLGAPTVMIEKLPSGDEALGALRTLEGDAAKRISAVIGWEMGGVSGLASLMVAAQMGLPFVDVDGMGRAFPRVDQTTYDAAGLPTAPIAITEPGGNSAVLDANGIEKLARTVTVDFGGWAMEVATPLRLADAVRCGVPGSLARALELGSRWSPRSVDRRWDAPASDDTQPSAATGRRLAGPEEVLHATAERAAASGGFLLTRGKVVEVWRESTGGFPRGTVVLQHLEDADSFLRLEMQGEYLIALVDGEPIATCPDIICCLDAESGRTIAAERITYGCVVDVLALPAPPQWLRPRMLSRVDPRAFGYDLDYVPFGGNTTA